MAKTEKKSLLGEIDTLGGRLPGGFGVVKPESEKPIIQSEKANVIANSPVIQPIPKPAGSGGIEVIRNEQGGLSGYTDKEGNVYLGLTPQQVQAEAARHPHANQSQPAERSGAGTNSNVTFLNFNLNSVTANTIFNSLAVTNPLAADGGGDGDTTEEIRQNASANYATQLRNVTQDDYLVRTLSMPAKYGVVSKSYIEPTKAQSTWRHTRRFLNPTIQCNCFTC